MVKCHGGIKPSHQPVAWISAGVRNELTNSPKVGTDHTSAINTTTNISSPLLTLRIRRSRGESARAVGWASGLGFSLLRSISVAMPATRAGFSAELIAAPPAHGTAEC